LNPDDLPDHSGQRTTDTPLMEQERPAPVRLDGLGSVSGEKVTAGSEDRRACLFGGQHFHDLTRRIEQRPPPSGQIGWIRRLTGEGER
jgi:hypothetical protein